MIPTFRAWYEEKKEMIYFDTLALMKKQEFGVETYCDKSYVGLRQEWPHVYLNDLAIMQAVQLTDRNEKLAYEQDIYCDNIQGHGTRWCQEKPQLYHKVIPYLIDSMNKEYAFPYGFIKMEIIGNIYQNSELLEV